MEMFNGDELSGTYGFIQTLETNEKEVISRMFDVLGNRSFLRHRT